MYNKMPEYLNTLSWVMVIVGAIAAALGLGFVLLIFL